MTDKQSSTVEPISVPPSKGQWVPIIGPETSDFLSAVVPKANQESMRDAALSIISRSVPPKSGVGQETGLVVGYIQSGKTMSFEVVTALARDNGFQMVIVITGTATALLEQSTGRLRRDLRIDDTSRPRHWAMFENPTTDSTTMTAIRDVLDDWRDPGTPEEHKRTILITVLKHHQRLQSLTGLIKNLNAKNIPVLIIDDEADQASLNVEVTQGDKSTTYRCIMELRRALPTHTYLQYTATPQAPLLVSIIDSLSPNFVQVLEPGDAYVGGQQFFAESNNRHISVIPPQEVPTNTNHLGEPPESLLDALRIFMLGVTVGIRQKHNTDNRSMLVHPSHLIAQHQQYYEWVSNVFENWKEILSLPDNEPDKQELIKDFLSTYNDLKKTVGSELPSFDELVLTLLRAFRNTRVLVVNTSEQAHTPRVEWFSSYGWILVGGQSMDRGFTVEGLTVTYMPRGIGVGNADTIQQRARFFGYKQQYLDYCRVYLEQETLEAFQAYVEHEEYIRAQLKEFQENNRPLNDWKRAFILDIRLKPCRQQVLDLSYMRGQFSNDWVTPRVVNAPNEIVLENQQTIEEFLQKQNLPFKENDGDPKRTTIQRHHVCCDIPLKTVMEQLLVKVRITGTTDSQRNTGLLLQLRHALESNPGEVCTIYRMSPNERRQRSISENGEITNLFQGEAPVDPLEQRGKVYPGDRAIRDEDNVTIQIHNLNLMHDGKEVAQNVPVLAVWVPARLERAWISQDQQ